MKIKFILCLLFALYVPNYADNAEEDLGDFDFESEETTNSNTSLDDIENDVDYEENKDENTKNAIFAKEEYIKKVMLNSMKNPDTKKQVARVLPILRVMTPDQKLALATLITTQVLTPPDKKGLSLDEVAMLFGNNPNTTEDLMLPISLDISNLFRSGRSEKGPTAEELRQPYRPADPIFRRNIIDRNHHKYYQHNSNTKHNRPRKPSKINNNNKDQPNCELFTNNICLKVIDYPIDAIMASIRRNKQAMVALLADYKPMNTDASVDGITEEQENKYSINEADTNEVRRTSSESGYMCQSNIRYARPQKARSTSGQWKYIVNTAEHTQTLRLEKCMKSGDPCTYLNDNYKSRCVQVYNYHRLLTWDQTNGLHMDIFKVPSCCSCHIDSYKVAYPPHHANHPTTVESFPGDDIEPDKTHLSLGTEHLANVVPNKKPSLQNHQESPEIYHLDPDKPRPIFGNPDKARPIFGDPDKARPIFGDHDKARPIFGSTELSKYLEAPKPPTPFTKPNYNQHFKRSNAPKPTPPVSKRPPQRPLRRRVPLKNIRDLAQSESAYGHNRVPPPSTNIYITEATPTTIPVSTTTKDVARRVNYNYHPIIDFFNPDHPDNIESRSDDLGLELGDTDWRPVTSINLMTERTHFKKL